VLALLLGAPPEAPKPAAKKEPAPGGPTAMARHSSSDLEDQIARLRDLDLAGLRARWRSMFRNGQGGESTTVRTSKHHHSAVGELLKKIESASGCRLHTRPASRLALFVSGNSVEPAQSLPC
jgi:hypothetical protein